MARRKTEVFSLSFLDVIACGFGADDIEHPTHRQIWGTLEKLHRAGKLADHRVVEAALLDDGLGKDDAAAFIEACMRDSENPESPQLAAYYHWLESSWGMQREELRTDYRFPSLAAALESVGFFFGPELAQRVREREWQTLPECTGLWWRRK